jgi:hypothetical protein
MDDLILYNPVYHGRVLQEREADNLRLSLRHKYMNDAEEMAFWAFRFGFNQPELEPESNEPF